jgi:hypothetical protein
MVLRDHDVTADESVILFTDKTHGHVVTYGGGRTFTNETDGRGSRLFNPADIDYSLSTIPSLAGC